MHGLDARDEAARTAKGLEAHHRPNDPFDRPMVLLDDVIEVLRLAQLDIGAGVGTQPLDGGRVGAAFINRDLLRHAVQVDGAFEESPRRSLVSAIEGINGIILIGWSTAFFVTLTARMRRT